MGQSTGVLTGESPDVSNPGPTEESAEGLPVNRSRPKHRSPAPFRGPRSFSTPRRTKAVTDSDIGSYFDRTKRKKPPSSPDEKDSGQGKMLKTDSADTVGS